jgi:hypothetical protein
MQDDNEEVAKLAHSFDYDEESAPALGTSLGTTVAAVRMSSAHVPARSASGRRLVRQSVSPRTSLRDERAHRLSSTPQSPSSKQGRTSPSIDFERSLDSQFDGGRPPSSSRASVDELVTTAIRAPRGIAPR